MIDMIEFTKNTRTTTFFRDLAIAKIKVAYRCMEYLLPDNIFPPGKLSENIIKLLVDKKFDSAAEEIIKEVNVNIDSASWMENLEEETIKLLDYLYKEYEKESKRLKEIRKQDLLRELKRLEME